MAWLVKRLSALTVETKRKPGRYPDGGGLYLQVAKGGSKSWLYRYMLNGRAREMGLGSVAGVSLEEARGRVSECRALLARKQDPIAVRGEQERARHLEEARALTFDDCAAAYIKAHRAGWRNAKHAAQWESTLATYASPVCGALPVPDVDEAHVMRVLEPMWTTKTETASVTPIRKNG